MTTSHKPGESIICTGKIKHVGSTYLKEWNFLKSLVPPERVKELKLTLPAPEWYHLRYRKGKAYPADVYANDEEYFADIAVAYRTELKILYENGVRNVTIDNPNLACESRPSSLSLNLVQRLTIAGQTSAPRRCWRVSRR